MNTKGWKIADIIMGKKLEEKRRVAILIGQIKAKVPEVKINNSLDTIDSLALPNSLAEITMDPSEIMANKEEFEKKLITASTTN